MLIWLGIIVKIIWSTPRTHRTLAIESSAPRQQLVVLNYRRPRRREADGRVVQAIEKGRVVDLKQGGGLTICAREWPPEERDELMGGTGSA